MLVEVAGCVFDVDQLRLSHGYEDLDPVAKEAFVNHVHIKRPDCATRAACMVSAWSRELRAGWPKAAFRIYRERSLGEVTIRFHMIRHGLANWTEACDEILEIGPESNL
jgi:hypothetical protein